MNLGEMTNYICSKVGQTDDNSKVLCRGFIQARYSSVYDSFPWRDSEMTATVSLISQNVVAMPDGMDRVIAVRAVLPRAPHENIFLNPVSASFLDPVNINMLMQTDPDIFEESGFPTKYREFVDIDKIRKIHVYPSPENTVSLFIVGKRLPVSLVEDSDAPILRNVDNVLINYAMGDMLERQRQYEKAKAKFEEAGAMLDAAKAVEQIQSNQPRRAKQLTNAGNSLAELTDAVCAVTGRWGPDDIVLIKGFLHWNYDTIWNSCNWSEATVCATVNTDGQEVILPSYFDRILSVRCDPNLASLEAMEPQLTFGIAPQTFEQTGSAVGFSYLTSVGVKALPPTRENLVFVSTSNEDNTNVFVMGESNGSEVRESVTLGGLVPVTTRFQYDTPITVAKNLTLGDVSVKGATSGALLETILSNERERRHMRIWLQPTPATSQVCLILGKRAINAFVQDEDTPLLRDIQSALVSMTAADMFTRMANLSGTDEAASTSVVGYQSKSAALRAAAAEMKAEGDAALKMLIDLETQQGAYSARVVPQVDYSASGFDWDYVTKGYW